MEIKPMKTAIVGCGMISDTYLESLKQFQILSVCACTDLNQERAKNTAEKYNLCACTFDEILQNDEIELILNLTVPTAHYDITRRALEAQKHVYSEKMLAVELNEGKELLRLAREKNVRLGVAPDTFLGAGLQTARYLVEHHLIGDIQSAVISVNRDFTVFGEFLPHLNKRGGSILFDVGCYYLTALVSILGPIKSITAMTRTNKDSRKNTRIGSKNYGEKIENNNETIICAVLQLKCGTLATLHLNSSSILDEQSHLELYGTKGILSLGDPNTFNAPVHLKKPLNPEIIFPFTHGYCRSIRGLGTADMAWGIRTGRPHRASMEMAFHVFEAVHGILTSASNNTVYQMNSDFNLPPMLPEGYLDNGNWGPTEESALAEYETN